MKDATGALTSILRRGNGEDQEKVEKAGEAHVNVSKLSSLVAEVRDEGGEGIMKELDWNLFKGLGAPPQLTVFRRTHKH